MDLFVNQKDGVFPSVCSLDCPDTCGLLVHKKDGKIIKIEGDPSHPVTQGSICHNVRNMPARLFDPVTSSRFSDMGGGATFFSTRVEVILAKTEAKL